MMTITAHLLLLLVAAVLGERKSYEGYAVIEVRPEDEGHVAMLQQLMTTDHQTDFWTYPQRAGSDVGIMVPPGHIDDVTRQLRNSGMKVRFRTRNIQRKLSRMWSKIDFVDRRRAFGDIHLDYFNTLYKIYNWLNKTATECRSGIQCEVYSAGQSYEGRPINVFKISKPGSGRKAYWIDATIHAREWLATATAVKLINHLAHGGDSDAVRLVDEYDWYIMPVVNPDGYSYTFTDNRFWRKNRHVVPGQECVGVDLNRNFNFSWGTEGVSHIPCRDTYCGPDPASEIETGVVQAEARRLANQMRGWLTMHAQGRMWMFSYGLNDQNRRCRRIPDHDDLMDVANAAADAIGARYSTQWARGNICEVIYAAAGSSTDYIYGVAGIKYSFATELRPGNFPFVIDDSEIELSFQEIWSGVVAMCDAIAAKEGY